MPDNLIAETHLDNPIVILALFIGVCIIIYKVFRLIRYILTLPTRKSHNKPETTDNSDNSQSRDDALKKFKEVHSKARDKREAIKKQIEENPQESANALRRMMKR